MATRNPLSDETLYSRVFPTSEEDEICISGIAGTFPDSDNIAELEYNLYNKIDMVNDKSVRWPNFHPLIPHRMGNIANLDRFDAQFFGINSKNAHSVDPQGRILIEKSYEAIMDAGINPKTLRGTRTGVYVGACFAESENSLIYEMTSEDGTGITGCSRAMLSNRISFSLGLQGPSFLVDTACSSSMYALDAAFSALRSGECDAAIVGGSNILLHPFTSLQFARLGVLASDGYCRPFDDKASGYARAEAICAIFLQKAKDAKRIYAKVVYSKTNCDGYKSEGITYPSGKTQQALLASFYKDIKLDPTTLAYMEAHSTGTVVGDPEECIALDNIFCKNRKTPLLVGSVKSNIGHSESSSGVCSIAKMILAYERNAVAPNIHFTKPRQGVEALEMGRLKVCTDTTKLDGPLIAVNSFGFGGANAHALFSQYSKEKINNGSPVDPLPRLVLWASRTEEGVNVLMNSLESQPLDAEHIGLLHNIQKENEPGFVYRGYGIFNHIPNNNAICLGKSTQHYKGLTRPLVYVFCGMGAQWNEMGTSLLNIAIVRDSIQKCHNILEAFGLDLMTIITSKDPNVYDDILNSFVGIAAIQIALVDVLNELELKADYFIGHSVGELVCGYIDGCLTLEQTVLSAYYRGIASKEGVIHGSMAAVALGYRHLVGMLPSSIEVACHNGPDSSTISGPADDVAAFVKKIKSQGVLAKEVNCSNIPYHSRYITKIGDKLLEYLKDCIPHPVKRSSKWISTSVPKNRWDLLENQYASAEYYTNNLLHNVLFAEGTDLLPENAITIEIGPHGLLQAILKKSMPTAIHVPLTNRGNSNNSAYLMKALGTLFLNGFQMPIHKLYPPVQFPVSRGTAKISPILRWDHSEEWFITKFLARKTFNSGEQKFKINLSANDYTYMAGHKIDGRCILPATGYLELVWLTLAKKKGPTHHSFNVEFEDVRFMRATALNQNQDIDLIVMVHHGTGKFEVSENNTPIVTGTIREIDNNFENTELPPLINTDFPMLEQQEFYKELSLRGYHYSGIFQSVAKARSDGLYGQIKWDLNWVSFMDCLLQLSILSKDSRSLILPTRIQKIRINAIAHSAMAGQLDPEKQLFDAFVCPELEIIQAGGIEIVGLKTSQVARRKPPGHVVLESYKFIPQNPAPKMTITNALRVCVQLCLENTQVLSVKAIEVLPTKTIAIIDKVEDILAKIPAINFNLSLLTDQNVEFRNVSVQNSKVSSFNNCLLAIASKCNDDTHLIEDLTKAISNGGYLLAREKLNLENIVVPNGYQLITKIPTEAETLVLFQKIKRVIQDAPQIVEIAYHDKNFEWLKKLQTLSKMGPVTLVSQNYPISGIIGLVNCIRREPEYKNVTCVFIDDHAPPFKLDDPFYSNQLKLGLAVNVFRTGKWGSYRHLKLTQNYEERPRSEHVYANVLRSGDLSSFNWIQGPINQNNENIVNIQYSSINFRDVMLATGRLSSEIFNLNRFDSECVLGLEYTGVNNKGQPVMGMAASGSMATQIVPFEELTWVVPDHLSLKEAATIPVVYVTVYCAFFMSNPITSGKSILIHAGSGGVGLAAIRIAFAYGLEVFTTVSTDEKKQFILNEFPQLKECNIGNSRDCSFEKMIKIKTRGKGVDYVLNSLAEEKLHASIRCLGVAGTFLEIGKFDLANDTHIGLGDFLKEMSFRSVLADNLFYKSTPEQRKYIHGLIDKDLKAGIIKPLHSTVFQVNEIEKAYRFLSMGKHMGKVIVQMRDDAYGKFSVPIKALPRAYFDAEKVYVIPGGLGGFGLELADWIVLRGARKLVISSSRGISNNYQSYRIEIWKSYGCKVFVSTADITTFNGCKQLLNDARQLGPIDGIFNLAVCLRDNTLDKQTPSSLAESMAPKADATKHLDELSRRISTKLTYFVVFSSVSCGRGNIGQSNYGMSNSVMERIVERRYADGLNGKAIQWGAIGEVGLVAKLTDGHIDMEIAGTLQQRIASCLNELDILLTTPDPVVACMVVPEKQIGSQKIKNIIDTVLSIMSIRDIKSVSMSQTLSELGMDSFMSVEILQTLEREYGVLLTTKDVRSMTLLQLQELSDENSTQGATGNETSRTIAKHDSDLLDFTYLIENSNVDKTGKDEKLIVRLSSKNNNTDYDSCVIILPGIEGSCSPIWSQLAAQINLPAFLISYLDNTKTIDEIVRTFIDEVLSKTCKNIKKFYIIGYSFGSVVALEIARILESTGLSGKILCIDGTPVFIKKLIYNFASFGNDQYTEERLQLRLITAIIHTLFPGEAMNDIESKLEEYRTWQEKLDKLVEFSKSAQIAIPPEYLISIATGLLNRLQAVIGYETENIIKIRSPITLIRPTEYAISNIDENYEATKYTNGIVNLKFIEGHHQSILKNTELISIINDNNL